MQEQLMIPGSEGIARRTTPMDLIQLAVSQNADVDKLAKLWELQKDWEKTEARKAYDEAVAQFKGNPPEITKNKKVAFGGTEYKHATLDHVVEQITPALSAVGITHRWEVTQADDFINVTCVLTHKAGHSELTTLRAKADTSGSTNQIQAIGSAVTYLQRYTLLAACGLAAAEDIDGEAGTLDDLRERLEYIENCRNTEELKNVYQAAYLAAEQAGDKNAQARIVDAKNAKYKELVKR